jgi:hypothetical protein
MSKKIAQLTKVCNIPSQTLVNTQHLVSLPHPAAAAHPAPAPVEQPPPYTDHQVIYHLNNRNEDYEFELQELAERCESEAAAARTDAAAKLALARQQLQEATEEAKARGCMLASKR